MTDRFAVRKTPQGHGVWDAAVNGWHSRQDLDEAAATELANTMNAGHVAREAHPDTGSRRVVPAKPVLVLVDGRWWPGHLDWWVHENDGWYGRATLDASGAASWYPAASLRPAPASAARSA
ncbi:hypothetical protein ACWDWO_11760 [Actinopolymorpha singaporensis]|uniref:Uncharacterized protein n=1 Tax=Actinopolymorpha singaporensis TaxID=117157 RepID=A0A1H1WZS5_9ACTN|nr:hypothetical protein [Actinopolymorpha singaporensis]SDT01749.1 hypothetical protein SAMN04489717_4715 [Actinopolymorpha singaporensis]